MHIHFNRKPVLIYIKYKNKTSCKYNLSLNKVCNQMPFGCMHYSPINLCVFKVMNYILSIFLAIISPIIIVLYMLGFIIFATARKLINRFSFIKK